MTVLDYFVLLIVLASVASGAAKGIIRVIVSVVFAVTGLVLATHAYAYAARPLRLFVAAWLANLLGFLLIFALVVVVGSLVSWRMRGSLKRARLGWTDHLLGALFGCLRGWLVCSAVFLALTAFPVKPEAVERAVFAPTLLAGTQVIAYLTSTELRERFSDGYETVSEIWEKKR
jgi:membrane protein required for colicin V production